MFWKAYILKLWQSKKILRPKSILLQEKSHLLAFPLEIYLQQKEV